MINDVSEARSSRAIIDELEPLLRPQKVQAQYDLNRFKQLDLEHISYSYNEASVLNDVSLHINQGEKVLLVGKSGSGKSTLLKIIAGMLHPSAGELSYNGINYDQFDTTAIIKRISYIDQKPIFFKGSVQENIILNRPYNNELYQKVSYFCSIDFEEKSLEEQGHNYSGGQLQ